MSLYKPEYLHVVLKDGTVRRFNYDDVDFQLKENYFIVFRGKSKIVVFVTPCENLMYYECCDDEYITEVRRY